MINNIGNVKDILIKMLDPAEGAFKTRSSEGGKAAARILAQVVDAKSDKAVLRWAGGRLSANIETPVSKGEQLLLEYYTQRGERACYRILARSSSGREEMPVRNVMLTNQAPNTPESSLWTFLFSFSNQTPFYPVMIKYFPEDEEEAKQNPAHKALMDVVVETQNLGLIILRMGTSGSGFFCNFLVEDEKAGEVLEEGIKKILESEGAEIKEGKELLSWKVFPVKKEVSKHIGNINISLDAHV